MNNMNDRAREFDEADQPIEAANSYEMAILDGAADLRDYISLMGLYFVSLDPGYAAFHKIGSQFLDFAFQRINELPHEIETRFGGSDEAKFWREYTSFIALGEDPNDAKWREYVENRTTVVPLIFFDGEERSGKYAEQLAQLWEAILSENTIRSRYIRSVLESNAR